MKTIHFDVNMEAEYLQRIGEQDAADGKLVGLADAVDETLAALRSPRRKGITLPWAGTEDKFRLRPGEVTLWGGYNGSGKSAMLGQIMTHVAGECGERVLVASFEMPLEDLIERHVQQIVGEPFSHVSDREYYNAMGPFESSYFVYTQEDDISPKRILGLIEYAASRLYVRHVVIDSLAMCNVPEGDGHNANLKRFVQMLKILAERHGIHVHLVAHLRKPNTLTHRPPTRFDIKYGGELADMAHNVVLVWRNELKEKGEGECSADAGLLVDKQRKSPSWCGFIPLQYNRNGGSWYE